MSEHETTTRSCSIERGFHWSCSCGESGYKVTRTGAESEARFHLGMTERVRVDTPSDWRRDNE